jgi:hypothetical protein
MDAVWGEAHRGRDAEREGGRGYVRARTLTPIYSHQSTHINVLIPSAETYTHDSVLCEQHASAPIRRSDLR